MSLDTQKNVTPRTTIVDFVRETRQEIAKVSWPTRKETLQTTIAIVVMALGTGAFFFVVDWIFGQIIGRILGMKS